MFKVILYTSHKKSHAKAMLQLIDKKHYVYHMFFKKSLVRIESKAFKNLKIAENDLAKVIAIDVSTSNFLHKDNCIVLKAYTQYDPDDHELKKLVDYLQEKVRIEDESLDMRDIVKEYSQPAVKEG